MHLFKRVQFRTPESVELEFTLAGIGNRALALVIDYNILAVILLVFIISWTIISIQLTDFWSSIFKERTAYWLLAIAFLICFIIYAGYFVFFETLWQGQTPGKRFAKIRVIHDDGRPIGLQQAVLRSLLRPVDEFLFLGAIFIMFGANEKRLGDFAAGTIVIQNQISITDENFIVSEQAKLVSEQLLQTANLANMLPDDFAVIREYCVRRSTMSSQARVSVAQKLTNQLLPIIHLDKLPDNLNSEVFLEAVYLAYQQVKS